jgi:hypothetical protein
MFLRDLFLNFYEMYTRPAKSRFTLAMVALSCALIYAVAANYEFSLSSSKLFFSAATLAVVQNFYFCVEKEVNVDEARHPLTWPNVCFILLVFFYFYLGNTMVFFVVINVLFYVRLLKSVTRPETRISIVKNLAGVLLTIPSFAVCADWTKLLVTLLGVPLSFAAWIVQVAKYEKFTFLNHYLLFNLVFMTPLAFAMDELPNPAVSFPQIALTILLILFGAMTFHVVLRFVIQTELKHVLLILNEFSMLYIAFKSGSWIVFGAFLALAVLTFRFLDFEFGQGSAEPLLDSITPIDFKSVEFRTDRMPGEAIEMEQKKEEPLNSAR